MGKQPQCLEEKNFHLVKSIVIFLNNPSVHKMNSRVFG